MTELVGRIFAGHLRSIVGSMTVEDIIRERQKLASEVLDASKPEMARLGLVVDAFQIESMDDGQAGYIKALSQPHIAAVNQAAQIAQAQADQAASKVRQESDRNQAQYQQQTSVAKAQYQAEIDQAQQTAAQAGPLAQAKALQDVLSEQALVAQSQGELRRQQLVAEVVRPAEAEAEKVRTIARGSGRRHPFAGRGYGYFWRRGARADAGREDAGNPGRRRRRVAPGQRDHLERRRRARRPYRRAGHSGQLDPQRGPEQQRARG